MDPSILKTTKDSTDCLPSERGWIYHPGPSHPSNLDIAVRMTFRKEHESSNYYYYYQDISTGQWLEHYNWTGNKKSWLSSWGSFAYKIYYTGGPTFYSSTLSWFEEVGNWPYGWRGHNWNDPGKTYDGCISTPNDPITIRDDGMYVGTNGPYSTVWPSGNKLRVTSGEANYIAWASTDYNCILFWDGVPGHSIRYKYCPTGYPVGDLSYDESSDYLYYVEKGRSYYGGKIFRTKMTHYQDIYNSWQEMSGLLARIEIDDRNGSIWGINGNQGRVFEFQF